MNDMGLSEFDKMRNDFEQQLVRGMLIQAGGNISRAAQLARMHRNTMGRKVYKYRIDVRECRRIAKQQRGTD